MLRKYPMYRHLRLYIPRPAYISGMGNYAMYRRLALYAVELTSTYKGRAALIAPGLEQLKHPVGAVERDFRALLQHWSGKNSDCYKIVAKFRAIAPVLEQSKNLRMKQTIITKAVLAKELKQSGLAFGDALECIDTLFESMAEALVEGKRVELRGFGSFKIVRLASRKTALNGGVTIPEHDRIHFRAGIKLRKAVSGNVKRKK